MQELQLSNLRPGEACQLKSIGQFGSLRRRLRDLGMQPGCQIQCAFWAPSGSPMAFWIKGAMIALRKSDCQKILVTRCE